MNDLSKAPTDTPISELAQTSAPPPPSPGELLAQRRAALGWTIDQAAKQIKLAPRQIEALEADDYSALPDKATARGFMRAYAKLLKLDANALTHLLKEECQAQRDAPLDTEELLTAVTGAPMPDARHASISRPILFALILALLLVIVLLAEMSGLIHWPFSATNKVALQSNTPVQTVEMAPVIEHVATPAPSPETGAPPIAVTMPTAPVATMTPTPTSPPPAPSALPVAQTRTGPNALVLHAQADTWIEVKRSDSKILLSRVLKAGAEQTLNVDAPVQVTVGNAAGLTLSWRGEPFDLKTKSTNNVARLTLE